MAEKETVDLPDVDVPDDDDTEDEDEEDAAAKMRSRRHDKMREPVANK
jgi:hypothetical protein